MIMNKKLFSYIASGLFAALSIHRILTGLGMHISLSSSALTAAFLVFTVYNYRDNGKSRGLYIGALLYLIGNGLYTFNNFYVKFTDFIILAAAVLLFVMFSRLYNSDHSFLHKYWFLPSVLVFVSFVVYRNFANPFIYLEPLGLFFMCLDMKNWY